MSSVQIGVVGLGRMGGNMAKHLLEKGYDVSGYDLDPDSRAAFESMGGNALDSPEAVASAVDVVITSLPADEVVREVYLGDDGFLHAADLQGTVAVEMSTIAPDLMINIADKVVDTGLSVLGAPVSGGPSDCAAGTLIIMAGGEQDVFESQSVQVVLNELGTSVQYTGAIDSAHTLKLLNNTMALGNLTIAAEAIAMGVERGVEPEILMEVLANAGGGSNQFAKRMPRIMNRNFAAGFPIDLGRKDLRLMMESADRMDRAMFLTGLVHQFFLKASRDGYGDEDIGAIVKMFENDEEITVESDTQIDESFTGY